MSRRESVTLTNMCMIYKGDEVLVQEKILKDGTGITFPGGHVEKQEPVYDSIKREVKEETGLELQDIQFCGIKEWLDDEGYRYIVFLYRCTNFTGDLHDSQEGKVYWVKRDALLSYPWIWHLDYMLEVFEKDKYSEVFLDSSQDYKPNLR